VLAGVRLPVPIDFALVAVAIAVGSLLAWRGLLPDRVADAAADDGTARFEISARTVPHLLRVLVPISLVGILAGTLQDAAATWSPIYLVGTLGLGAGIGASAFVLYTASMTGGRLTNDRWVNRWGSVAVVRVGALIAAAGLALVIVAAPLAVPALAFAGYAALGFGIAPMFPAMLAAAGTTPGIPTAHGIAIVFLLTRIGGIVSPALLGVVADARGLSTAFVIPLVASLVIAAFVPRMIGRGTRVPIEAEVAAPTDI
jgi:fucose permease